MLLTFLIENCIFLPYFFNFLKCVSVMFLFVTQLLFTFYLVVVCTQQRSASLSEYIDIYATVIDIYATVQYKQQLMFSIIFFYLDKLH